MSIRKTDETLRLAADRLDKLIVSFLRAREPAMARLGKWEAQIEAKNLFNIAIRHAEAVLTIAQVDWPLVAPGAAAARCALECAVRAAWLVNGKDEYECEARFLAHLAEEEEFLKGWEKQIAEQGNDPTPIREKREGMEKFRLQVTALLPQGVVPPKNITTRKMLASIDGKNLYMLYRQLSQHTHGSHAATSMYRGQGLGKYKLQGDFVKVSDWYWILYCILMAFTHPARLVLARIGGDAVNYLPDGEEEEIRQVLGSVSKSKRTLQDTE